jgi:hypothetical protein
MLLSIHTLIESGGGTGPTKPRQPLVLEPEGANSGSNWSAR